MWSQVPAVQVVAWRMLNRLRSEGWAQDAIDMLYLDEEALAWAQDGQSSADAAGDVVHKDVNGTVLEAGDTVTLIKDLKVKGGGFTAKRGTAVRGISLVPDDPKHIEGRVSGQQIVIIAEYVKKS
jgi:protein PhnA